MTVKPLDRAWLDRSLALLVALASAAWVLQYFDRGISPMDEGFVAALSMRVWRGEVPYRDFFTVLTPGVFLLHAALYEVFGPTLWVGRCVALLMAGGIPVLVFLAARRLLNTLPALAASALSLLWGPAAMEFFMHANYNWLADLCGLLALWLCALHVDRRLGPDGQARAGWGPVWAAGAALGLAIAFKQSYGGYAFIAIAAFLLWLERQAPARAAKAVAALGTAALLVNLPILVWLGRHGALESMVEHTLKFALSDFARGAALPYPRLWPAWPGFPSPSTEGSTVVLAWVPWSCAVLALWWLADRWREARSLREPEPAARRFAAQSLLLLMYCGMVFIGIFPRADLVHLLYTMSAGFIALMLLAQRLHAALSARFGLALAVSATVVLAALALRPLFEQPMRQSAWTLGARQTLLEHPRARVMVSPRQAAEWTELLAELDRLKAQGASIFALPSSPMVYFLADLQNPTRYDVLIPGNHGPGGLLEVMDTLRDKRVTHVVLHHELIDGRDMGQYAPELATFLKERYMSVRRIGDYEILSLPGQAPQPAAPALTPPNAPASGPGPGPSPSPAR